MIDAAVYLGNPAHIPIMDAVPGESRPLRAVLRAGGEDLGVLFGRLPATRSWERADGDLLELFASHVAVAIRNAQLFAQVEEQNAQLIELDAAKDEFLRGVSHNLQTPLTSIRAHAEQLGDDRPDRRLGIIAEQAERLSRMVRQLADRDPPRVRGIQAEGRRRGARRTGQEGLGGARRRRRGVHPRRPLRRLAGHRRRGPARPGAVGAPRQRREVRRAPTGVGRRGRHRRLAGRLAAARHHHGRRAAACRRPIASGSSAGSSAAPSRPPTGPAVWTGPDSRGPGSGSTSRASCAGRWTATWCSSRRWPAQGAAFSIYLPGEAATE